MFEGEIGLHKTNLSIICSYKLVLFRKPSLHRNTFPSDDVGLKGLHDFFHVTFYQNLGCGMLHQMVVTKHLFKVLEKLCSKLFDYEALNRPDKILAYDVLKITFC